MADFVQKIIDTDGTVGIDCDYNSLADWQAGEIASGTTDLVAKDEIYEVICKSSAGSADTTTVTIDTWITDETHTLTIKTSDSDRHNGVSDC